MDFLGEFLRALFRSVNDMKSQLVTTLSIVGVLGTATTAMAINTDTLANIDPSAIGTATDTLLTDPNATTLPADAPTATPAPTDPSATPAPSDPSTTSGTTAQTPGQPAPAVQNPQAQVVNGTTGGSGTRVAGSVPASTNYEDDDEHEDEDHEDDDHEDDEHEEEDDD